MKLVDNFIVQNGNEYFVGNGGIARIEDTTLEYPDHTEVCLDCYNKDNQLIKRVINCGVDITYLVKVQNDNPISS